MTLQTNARIAGFMFLFYIVTAITSMILYGPVDSAVGVAGKLAAVVEHPLRVRLSMVLTMIMIVDAIVLAVALYAITRDQDKDLAFLAMSFRLCEGALNAFSVFVTPALLWLATDSATGIDPATTNALAALLVKLGDWIFPVDAWVFAVGSTLFAYLFLRARSIPVWLAWVGLAASILVVLLLPGQLVGLVTGEVTRIIWLPMLVYEVVLGFWLLIKGVQTPSVK